MTRRVISGRHLVAAALKLARWRCAADDARVAIERDAKHLRAHIRAATAHLELREPDAALVGPAADIARHVIGCQRTQEARVKNAR
jgi:hypothetical protein